MSAPIIITVPNNYLSLDNDTKLGIVAAGQPCRKRRLDHLTWEEKMQRKKLKNRVAAQTSRDRKKAKMEDMEQRIESLENVNERLISEMESLRALNERLLSENGKLKAELAAGGVGGGAAGPAASSPRQQEAPPQATRAARLLLTLCLLSQTCSTTSMGPNALTLFNNLQTPSYEKLMKIAKEKLHPSMLATLDNALSKMKWWGPQQSTWNPVKVGAQ